MSDTSSVRIKTFGREAAEVETIDFSDRDAVIVRKLTNAELQKLMWGGGVSVQMQLNALYAANGLTMSKEMFPIMEDHIGLEMAFMAEILDKHDEAKAFFKEHLEKWAVRFANDIYKYSERDFYKGIARITIGFIDAETEYFKG